MLDIADTNIKSSEPAPSIYLGTGGYSASERHDYRYSELEMQHWAQTFSNQRQHFDTLYVYFQNTTQAHAVHNIAMLRQAIRNQHLQGL